MSPVFEMWPEIQCFGADKTHVPMNNPLSEHKEMKHFNGEGTQPQRHEWSLLCVLVDIECVLVQPVGTSAVHGSLAYLAVSR